MPHALCQLYGVESVHAIHTHKEQQVLLSESIPIIDRENNSHNNTAAQFTRHSSLAQSHIPA
jgi:hypothetical protein